MTEMQKQLGIMDISVMSKNYPRIKPLNGMAVLIKAHKALRDDGGFRVRDWVVENSDTRKMYIATHKDGTRCRYKGLENLIIDLIVWGVYD